MNRGYQTLLVSKLRRGEYLHKDAFVEITTTDNTEVGHNTLWLFTHSSSPQGEKVGRPKYADPRYDCKGGETSCCLGSKPMTMTDLGLDFIIFPSIIQYTFCQGSCAPDSLFIPTFRYVWRQKANFE